MSGQRLCEELGVSRTAVWKVIRQLKEEGYHVEAVQNRGYRIVDIPDVMSEEELKSLIAGKTQWAGQEIHYFSETDSTNIRAKELGEKGAPHGTLAVAGQQSAGRGRRGRGWESPPGCDPAQAPVFSVESTDADSGDGLQRGKGAAGVHRTGNQDQMAQ